MNKRKVGDVTLDAMSGSTRTVVFVAGDSWVWEYEDGKVEAWCYRPHSLSNFNLSEASS